MSFSFTPYDDTLLLETMSRLAVEAGALIMQFRAEGFVTHHKKDTSPVTEADRAADRWICDALRHLTPTIPIVSEEGTQHEEARISGTFWCVDPLDGTKSFIRGEDEFTVNIGLIVNHTPHIGVIYIPVSRMLYAGGGDQGAWRIGENGAKETIHARTAEQGNLTAVTSTRHGVMTLEHLRTQYGVTHSVSASSSLKFCVIAEGNADIYPRFGTTMEWDTAAGHALLCAAGGRVERMDDNTPLVYGKEGFVNPHFVAYGG
jgi:3'(2'), 5'-bisphosphate nucleotidase